MKGIFKLIALTAFLMSFAGVATAQVGIGITEPNATLDISGTEETALDVVSPVSSITGHLVNIERTVAPAAGSDLLQLKSPGGGATDNFQFLECQYGEQVVAKINGNGHINATSLGAGTEYPTARITVDDNLWDVLLDIRQNNNPSVVDYMVNFEKTVIPYSNIDLVRMALPPGSPDNAQFLECEKGGTELVQINANGDVIVKNGGDYYVQNGGNYYAQNGGDFLTTSSRPGYAMKVNDFDRARGAIIGKAMTTLNEEHGLVLVLVSLQ